MAGDYGSLPALAIAACCWVFSGPVTGNPGEPAAAVGAPPSEVRSATATGVGPGQESAKAAMRGEWRLIAIDRTELSRGGTPTVVFGEEGSCWGSTGVNDFRTTFMLQGLQYGRVKVGNAAVTRKMGPPEAMALEKLFLTRLESVISFEVTGDLLHLHSGDDQNLTFERVLPQ